MKRAPGRLARRNPRISVDFPVIITRNSKNVRCHARQLSEGGIFLTSALKAWAGEEIQLELALESKSPSLCLPGVVLYSHSSGMGIGFKSISENQRDVLKKYVRGRAAIVQGGSVQSSGTAGEELAALEESLRHLKMEYEIYFNGGSERPPAEAQSRFENTIRKFSDSQEPASAKRFGYDELCRRYRILAEVWREKIRALGRNPRQMAEELRKELHEEVAFRVRWRDPAAEPEKVERLLAALIEVQKRCGEDASRAAIGTFKRFVRQKTAELKWRFHCDCIEFLVVVEEGRVKLKARSW